MERLMEDVEKGTLDYALTKPDDAQVLVSVREVRIWQAVDIVMGAGVLIWAAVQLRGVGVMDVLAFVGALALGATIIYCFWLMLASTTFWVVQVWQILELFQGVYAAGRWPVGIYPLWLKTGLTFLVPLAFAVTVPAEGLTSRLNGTTLLGAAAFTVALLAVTRWVWKRGLRRYSGASA
jgi:ABC-2 type transport system permease protein